MEVYAFDWRVIETQSIVLCFAKYNDETITIAIHGYQPSYYVESDYGDVYMPTTNDITDVRSFDRHYFSTVNDMKESRAFRYALMCHEEPVCHFLASVGLSYVGWIRVDSREVDVSTIVPLPRTDVPVMRVASFDIEVYCPERVMPSSYRRAHRIFMICVACDGATKVLVDEDEMALIDRFCDALVEMDPDVITGFNIFNFDFRYIRDRLLLRLRSAADVFARLSRAPALAGCAFRDMKWANASYGDHDFVKPDIPGRLVIDAYQYFRRMKSLDSYSLNNISKHFLNDEKVPLGIDDMMTQYEQRDFSVIASYCLQDACLVVRLVDQFDVIVDLLEQARILTCRVDDILTRGEQFKINHRLVFECVRREVMLMPCRQPAASGGYDGALVHEPTPGIYDHCVTLDYQSLYPSIIISKNICPSTYTPSTVDVHEIDVGHTVHHFRRSPTGILPGLLEDLLTERKEIKKVMGDNIVLHKRQNALKIAANSIYGITGAAYSKYLRHRPCAESITGCGRHYFNELVNFVPENQLVYGDTDSCILAYPSREEGVALSNQLCDRFNATLPYPMYLKYECYSRKMLIFSKKKYIMLNEDGTLTYKGVTNARRGYCRFVKDLYQTVVDMMFADDVPPEAVLGYVIYRLKRIDQEPLDAFVISKSVKHPASYSTDVPQKLMAERLIREGEHIVPGTRLEYVFVKNDHKKQGLKMYRPEELERHHLAIDYQYYICKQVQSTIDQLLALIGHDKFIKRLVL